MLMAVPLSDYKSQVVTVARNSVCMVAPCCLPDHLAGVCYIGWPFILPLPLTLTPFHTGPVDLT